MIKYLGVDTMGLSKDLLDNPASEEHINNHIDSVVRDFPNLTHIGISVPMNTNAEALAARGSNFAIEPATYMARFMDRIHYHGKKVLFRGTNCYYEAIYSFPSQNFRNGNRFNYLALPVVDDFSSVATRSHGYGLTSAAGNISSNYLAASDSGNDWTISGSELVGPAANGWRRALYFNASLRAVTFVAKVKKVGHQEIRVRGSQDPNFPGYGLQMRDTNTLRFERPGLANLGQCSKTWVSGQWYWLKITANGTAIKGKAWAADDSTYPNSTDGSENEPLTGGESGNNNGWDLEITDSTYTEGYCGFAGESSNGHFDRMTILPIKETGTWIQRTCDFWINNIGLLRNGDSLACFPEAAFGSFSNGGSLSQFFIDLQYCLDKVCADNLLTCNNGFPSQLFTTVIQGSISSTVFQNAGMVSFDHYGTALGLNKRFGSFFHGNSGYANTYGVPTSIVENTNNRHDFIPEKVAYNRSIDVFIVDKGTGDWTMTIHKANNSPVQMPDPQTMVYSNSYQVTIPNASLVNGALNTFPIDWDNPDTDTTYHYHLTSTQPDGTVKVNTAGNLNTAYTNGYKANASPEALEIDLRKCYAKYGLPLYLQEWGDFWSKDASRSDPVRTQAEHEAYLDSIYAVKKRLIDEGILQGYQYWRTLGGLEGINSDVDPGAGFDYQLNYKGLRLKAFFDQLTVFGQEGYSREALAALPSTDSVLGSVYNTTEVTDVSTDDDVFVELPATSAGYNVHLFKKLYDIAENDAITATIKLKTTRPGSAATIYLQIFNQNTQLWETLDSDNSVAANTEFTLTGVQSTNLADYYDSGHVVSFRVYQAIA